MRKNVLVGLVLAVAAVVVVLVSSVFDLELESAACWARLWGPSWPSYPTGRR